MRLWPSLTPLLLIPLLTVCAHVGAAVRPRDFVCNGVVNPPERRGVCGRPLYYMAASYCCWFCHAWRVIKHNPERLHDLNRGDARHFNFTQCRSTPWETGSMMRSFKKRSSPQPSADEATRGQMRKLESLNRKAVWQITPSGTDLHCDCCVNSCSINHLGRYCSCLID